ncbi:MAG: ATP-binding protein [Acidimicrobiia bacterium]
MSGWDHVTGQDRAVALLQHAAERPVHAYLLVGPRGAGVEEAARCFGAALVASGDDERAWDLARRGRHPDVVEFEPTATTYSVNDDVRDRMIPEAYRSPIEGERKVVVIYEAERLRRANRDEAANALLKTLEEPPERTVMVLVTAYPDELPETVRSRCQRIDFGTLDEPTIRATLTEAGVDANRAATVARLAGGRLDRARALAGRLGPLREAFVDAAANVDGTGATVAEQLERLDEAIAATVAELEAAHGQEIEELTEELESAGYPDRTATALKKRLAERQKREHRRARLEALVEGITALETVYRDALAGPDAPALNTDRPTLNAGPRGCDRALRACRAGRDALGEFNPNEGLLLERLLLHLPGLAVKPPL